MAKIVRKKELNDLQPPADLEREIERLQENLTEERGRHVRTLADLKNYRRRVERDGNKLAEEGKRQILLPLLSILDDLAKASKWTTDGGDQVLAKSLQAIHQKLLALLQTQGVHPFDSVDELFTPNLHEAVAVVEDEGIKPGTVVDEVRRGYLWKNELLRPAYVRVAG